MAKQQTTDTADKAKKQLTTVNGDVITHAHVFQSNQNKDVWFFTAKMNGAPLKPQVIPNELVDKFMKKEVKAEEMMKTVYPSKMHPKVKASEFKVPFTIDTPTGQETVHKFNVYKEKNQESPYYGQYRFYAQVGDTKMSEAPTKADLNAYFDRTKSPAMLMKSVFGERLRLPEHYAQFQLPDGVKLGDRDIRISKNEHSNRFEISANLGKYGYVGPKSLSYNDTQAIFKDKTATKEQLVAKHLTPEISKAIAAGPKKELSESKSLSR